MSEVTVTCVPSPTGARSRATRNFTPGLLPGQHLTMRRMTFSVTVASFLLGWPIKTPVARRTDPTPCGGGEIHSGLLGGRCPRGGFGRIGQG